MTRKRRRMMLVLLLVAGIGTAAALMLAAFEDNVVFFFSPTDLKAKPVAEGRQFRLGGLVEKDSVRRTPGTLEVKFRVTDGANALDVTYEGVLPDLFREGQGVVAEGRIASGVFVARNVLAKHDETYMPPEVADALKRHGHWQDKKQSATQ
ncbi:MAG: cytochrome c maturation protein CcmE [Alphaproteobacteria bacterium]|nr:cytochrome c maturation protein CcmE [Alphaproteobacteria bacterium]